MQRKFILNLVLLIFLNLLVKPFYILGIDTEILNRVGQDAYGTYFALINLSFLLNIFLDLGIVNFNTGNIARHSQLLTKHFAGITAIRLLLSLMYLFICFITALILGYRGYELTLLLPICFNQVLAGFILYFRSNLSGLQLFAKDSLVSVMDRLLLIIACSAVLWGNFTGLTMSIELFIYLQTFAYSLTFLFAFFSVRRKTHQFLPKIKWSFTLVILRKSFPYALLILLMSFYYRTDGIMLERMLDNGAYEAGIYAQAFRFFEAGNMVSYLFAALIFPMFSKILKDKQAVYDLMMLSFRLIFTGSVIFGLAAFFYSQELMELRFDSEIENASRTFSMLMISFIAVSGTYIFGTLLTANGNLRSLNLLAVGAAILNVILNLFLIPTMKAEGAAFASAITQILVLAGQIWLVKKVFKFNILPTRVVRMMILPLLCFIVLTWISHIPINWLSQAGLYLLISIPLAFVTRMFTLDHLKKFARLVRDLRSSVSIGSK